MLEIPRQLSRFLVHLVRRFSQDRCLQIASSLTFTTLLALVPLVTIALTLISAFPIFSGLGEQIRSFLLANMLPEAAGKVVATYVEQFSVRAGRLTALGTAVLVVTALMMMFTIERAFNSIWRVLRGRSMVQRVLIYWAVLTLGPILIGASLTMTSYLVGASLGMAQRVPFGAVSLLGVIPAVLTSAAFTLLYLIVPNRAVKPRHALVGGIAAALAFELMKRGFATYITHIPTYTFVYGAFAAFPIFLLWIYFSWVVIVVGALITALAPDFFVLRGSAKAGPGAEFGEAVSLLIVLAKAQQVPELLDLGQIANRASLTGDRAELVLERMATRGWVSRAPRDRFGLVCDTERLTLADIYLEFVADITKQPARDQSKLLKSSVEKFSTSVIETLRLPLRRLLDADRD
jgi:membrane protein